MPAAITLLQLKQQALQTYRSRQFVTGTVASFNTTMLIDSTRQEPQGEFETVDSFVRFTSSTANGGEARVMGWSPGNSSILFAPSVPSLNASTNYQITKTFNNTDANYAVNAALRDMAPERRIQSFATANEVGDVQTISVPSAAGNTMTDIIRVERSWGTTASPWLYRELLQPNDFSFLLNNGALTMQLNYPAASGSLVRFQYRRPAAELSADTDATDEPISLILAGTKKWLAIQEQDQSGIDRYGREFEACKRDYIKNLPNQTIQIPRMGVTGYGGGRSNY